MTVQWWCIINEIVRSRGGAAVATGSQLMAEREKKKKNLCALHKNLQQARASTVCVGILHPIYFNQFSQWQA